MINEQSLTKGQQSYVTRIVNEIKNDGKQKMDNLYGELKENLEKKINELSGKLTDISNYYENLFNGSEENKSIKAQIEGYIKDLTGELDNIRKEYNTLITGEDGIIKQHEIAIKMKDEINDLLKNVNSSTKEFNEYYEKIFGKKDEEGNRKGGLKEEIEKRSKEYIALKNKIENLLPGATSAGLAAAYQEQKKTFFWQKWVWSGVFMLSLGGMLLTYLLIKIDYIPEIEAWRGGFIRFLIRIPTTVPFIWLALFSGKQQNKNQRLEQEYAYKESLSRSFEGYRREIEKLGDSESAKQLQIDLLKVIVKMSDYNPSITLESKSNIEKSPYGTLFENILEKMDSYLKTANILLEKFGNP